MRSLEKHIEKIARKIAYNRVELQEETNSATGDKADIISKSAEAVLSERTNAEIFRETHNDSVTEIGLDEFGTSSSAKVEEPVVVTDVENVSVTIENLETYVGKAKFNQDTIYDSAGESLPPGVVMGLAWNPLVSKAADKTID